MQAFCEQVTSIHMEGGSPKYTNLVAYPPVISTLIGTSSFPRFALTGLSPSAVLRFSIDRPLMLDMLHHVFSTLDTVTPFSASNANETKTSLRSVASMIQSGN